jgi:hypothetical protein
MKTTAEKEFNRTSKKFYEWKGKARTAAENYLRDVLRQQENRTIEFDTEYDDECLAVIYDGGNHPEYASNVCSSVYSIYMDKYDRISLSIEDSPDYELRRVDILDLLAICESVKDSWVPRQGNVKEC